MLSRGVMTAACPTTHIVVETSREALARRVAASLVHDLRQCLRERERPVVVLSAGRTPAPVYALLRTEFRLALPWRRISLFQMDEYAGLAANDQRSFRAFLRRSLVEPLAINATYLQGNETDAQMAAYEKSIRRAGGIDLVLHGVGINGHLGFNEPGAAPDSPSRHAQLALATRYCMRRAFRGQTVPRSGPTLGLGVLNASRRVRVVAVGKAKRRAIREGFLQPPARAVPVSSLQAHANVHVFVDKEAWVPPQVPSVLQP